MTLQNATVSQLIEWQAAIIDELARRASTPQVAQPPQPPWMGAVPPPQYPVSPPPVREPSVWRAPQQEPMRRPAIGAGESGRGEATQSLMSTVGPQYAPARRPPGTVYETGSTDPDLARAFHSVPARPDGLPPIHGNGAGHGQVDLGS